MDYEKLARSRLPIPPLSEQTAIARYLDHADRRVQRYIGAKRKLVKLLEEQKQAVTGQIDVRTTELEEQLDSMKQDIREGVDALTEAMAELASGSVGLVGDGLSRGSEFAGTDAHGIHRASSSPRAVRKSIEPAICDGAWCLFRTPVQGCSPGS